MKKNPSRHPHTVDDVAEVAPRARPSAPPPALGTTASPKVPRDLLMQGSDAGSWLAMARGLSADEVEPCRVDVQVACHNLVAGAENLTREHEQLASLGVVVDSARLASTAGLAAALTAVRVPPYNVPTGCGVTLRAVTPLRRAVFADAKLQVDKGRLDAEVVGPLLRTTDVVDRMRALLQIVEQYGAAQVALAGHTTLDDDDLRRAKSLATEALSQLRVSSSRREGPADARAQMLDLRDRYWTLAVRHHAWMQRIAGAAWGDDLRAYVPPLASRRRGPRAKVTATPAAPVGEPVKP